MRTASAAPWKGQDALRDDVAEDLARAGLDRVAAAAQLLITPVAVVLAAVDLHCELRQALVLLRPAQLRAGALGPRDAGLHQRRQRALVHQLQRLELDPLLRDPVADDRIVCRALLRQRHEL